MSISVLNTDAGLSGKELVTASEAHTVTGLHTFDRDPNPPFAVSANSAEVTNLIAARATTADGPTNGQFAFPASQNASAGANTLDDYEEGTWIPVLGGSGGTSGQTYTTQAGHYVKIGQLVYAAFTMQLSAKGTITGDVQIQGLPFTSAATVPVHHSSIDWASVATAWIRVSTALAAGSTAATLFATTAATTNSLGVSPATADINNNSLFRGVIIYRASA